MDDCLIVGGGVIGLSLAYELAGHGLRVRVLDRGEPGGEASWAGAGILPPANPRRAVDPLGRLAGLSYELHAEWAGRLREETGIDNGFRRCGGLYLASTPRLARDLTTAAEHWRREEIEAVPLAADEVARLEPKLSGVVDPPAGPAAWLVPGEAQLRNPWHLDALVVACSQRGVAIHAAAPVDELEVLEGRVREVRTVAGSFSAESVCLTAGAWTGPLARRLGFTMAIKPIRGQIALLATPAPLLSRVVNEGPRYLVPRPDGKLLVGSTEEDAGFDKSTTPDAIADLLALATRLCPALADAKFERAWAGLRPGTADGLPYLGRAPGIENLYVAAGHFRSGLLLSPGTAVVMGRLIRGESPGLDLRAFRLNR